MRRIFSVFISKQWLQYFMFYRSKLGLCALIQLKNDQRNAAHLFSLLYPKNDDSMSMFYLSKFGFCALIQRKNDQWNAAHLVCFYIPRSQIHHSHHISLFTFEEPQLDAESSLENIRDTNIRSFLRRFWIRYQNVLSSHFQKMTYLVLQVVFFWISITRRVYSV
mgnify:CR=1 FL=1